MAPVLLEVRDGSAFITLNREEKRNAFNREMALALQHALDECRDNDAVRAVCITGKGVAFSAGQDLAAVANPTGKGLEKIISEQYNPLITRIRKLPKPIVAAVNGIAAGGGANIALSCDIVVATASATFIQAFSKIGLMPDCGGTYFLPRLIGFQKAAALMMLGDKVTAQEAERMGMIYKVYDDEHFPKEVLKLLTTLSQMPTLALALTKEALNDSMQNNFEQQLDVEDRLQSIAGRSADFAEGIASFLQKRSPVFVGK